MVSRKSVTGGGQWGHNSLSAESLGGAEVPTMSHILYSLQYICSRKALGSNMGAQNLFLIPGAIYLGAPWLRNTYTLSS